MGQDLLLLSLDWPVKLKESPQKGFQKTCAQIDKRIDKIKNLPGKNDVDEISGGAWVWDHDEEGCPELVDDDGNVVTLDAYKQYLYDLVDDIRGSWNGRDTTCFCVASKHWIFITGGNSWGDSPSETYDVLSKLYSAGVV